MNDWLLAHRHSASLDTPGHRPDAGDVPPAIARVHEALSRPGSVPRVPTPPGLSDRVLAGLSDAPPALIPFHARPAFALAATILLVLSAGVVYTATRPAPAVGPTPTPAAPLNLDASYLTALPARAEPLTLAVGEPLIDEARLMREDARRAARSVLARLPTRLGP